ncbi:unnamed protein product [Prunus brigantina]
MQSELNALLQTNTWTLVPPSPLYNLVGCKWVYRVKFKPDGSVDRFKARLVAKGFHQQEGLDYHETFSPVAKPVTIRLLLSLAVQYGWFLHQLDVPRAWYDELFQALIGLGFQSSQADTSLFIKAGPDLVFILVYVDDILVTGSSPSACQQVIQHLSSQFPVKDLGSLHYFLGLQVTRSDRGLFLNQTKYAYDLLHKTDFLGAKACTTPLGSFRLDNSSPLLADPTFYRSTVGALQYLTWTRPDLAFAVNQVCQFMHQPRESHLGAVKRILRYLKGTLEHGLWFQQGSTHLSAYSDADWAGCPIDRRSTEAEYRGIALAAAELVYISKLFKDIGLYLADPPTLWCDNQSAMALASNPVFHARTKHIEVDYHFIRELVLLGYVRLKFVSSSYQLADIFTKSLSTARFQFLCSKLSVCTAPFSLRGADRATTEINPSHSSQSKT